MLIAYAVAAVGLWLEVTILSVIDPRSRRAVLGSLLLGIAMFAGNTVASVPIGIGFRSGWNWLQGVAPSPFSAWFGTHRAAAGLVAFVVWDAAGFAYHWLGHHTKIGWAAHRPHHTGVRFDLTLGLRQSWLPVLVLPVFVWTALLGLPLSTVLSVAALSTVLQFLQHSALLPRIRLLEGVVMQPAAHRLHHERELVNLGPVLTIWDRVAGTWTQPGATNRQVLLPRRPTRLFDIELSGWQELLRSVSGSTAARWRRRALGAERAR